MTIPITDEAAAPFSTVLDETYKIAITRFDQRIRVGGMAEIVGFNTQLEQNGVKRWRWWYAISTRTAAEWRTRRLTGLRPMTPDGTPIVGRTSLKNLYLNTGHGTLGWTMACGSGQLLSDLMSGITPAIPSDDLAVARYSAGFRQQHAVPLNDVHPAR